MYIKIPKETTFSLLIFIPDINKGVVYLWIAIRFLRENYVKQRKKRKKITLSPSWLFGRESGWLFPHNQLLRL